MNKNSVSSIQDLYPHFTAEQLAEVEDAYDRYLTLVLRIFERVEAQMVPQVDSLSPDTVLVSCEMSEQEFS